MSIGLNSCMFRRHFGIGIFFHILFSHPPDRLSYDVLVFSVCDRPENGRSSQSREMVEFEMRYSSLQDTERSRYHRLSDVKAGGKA